MNENKQKTKSDEVLPGRGMMDWLNGLTKKSFGQRKQKAASEAFRAQLIREAEDFARILREDMPKSATQLTESIVLLSVRQTFPKAIAELCLARIEQAKARFQSYDTSGSDKHRHAYNERCGLESFPDCVTLLRINYAGRHYVKDEVGNVHLKNFTISKWARVAFAAVINVLAEEFMKSVLADFEKSHNDGKSHNITALNVQRAMKEMKKTYVFNNLPVVFDDGRHNRNEELDEPIEPAPKRVKVDA